MYVCACVSLIESHAAAWLIPREVVVAPLPARETDGMVGWRRLPHSIPEPLDREERRRGSMDSPVARRDGGEDGQKRLERRKASLTPGAFERCAASTRVLGASKRSLNADLDASLQPSAGNELVDFIVTELEQQHARLIAVSAGLKRLERVVEASHCDVAALAGEQRDMIGQSVTVMRRLEVEAVHGANLRDEEVRLRDAKLDKSLLALRQDVDESLKAAERAQQARVRELQDKLDKVVVDVVVENQTLRAENMELRAVLQQVLVAANSNKKTLRVLTDEILKLKRQVAASSDADGPDSASDRLERGIALALRVATSNSSQEP